jgi:O-antigen/teichoic acid export membrane protein
MTLHAPTEKRPGFTARAAWLAAAKFVALATTILLPLLLVRRLSQAEFGLYKLSFQILTGWLSLLLLQVSATAYYFMPREPEKKPQVAVNILFFYSLIGLALTLLFTLTPGLILKAFNNDALLPYLPLIGPVIALWLVSSPLEIFMVSNGDVRSASVIIVLIQISKTLLLLAAGMLAGTVRFILLAAIVQGVLQLVLLLAWLRWRFGPFRWVPDWPLLRAQLANALPFGVGGMVYSAHYEMHNYFVSAHYDTAQFAIYSVGCFQLLPLFLMIDSAETILIPEVARLEKQGDYAAIRHLWLSLIRRLLFFLLPSCGFFFVLRHEFITALFTPQYAAAAPIFAWSLLNILLVVNMSTAMMRAFDDFKYYRFKLYASLLPVMAASLYLGLRTAGLSGVMIALVGVRALDTAITSWRIGRRIQLPRRELRSLAPALRMAAAAIVAALATLIVKVQLADRPAALSLAVCFAVYSAVYLAVAFPLGGVMAEEKAELRRILLKFSRRKVSPAGIPAATEF